jgi:predicted CoA-binding protein
MMDNNPGLILSHAKSILLVDWPNPGLPRTLLKAGYKVFGYSPGNYSSISLESGSGELIFAKLPDGPGHVDIVNVFRPEDEHAAIIATHVFPLKAKALWLHPPVISAKTALFAKQNRLNFIEGISITDVATALSLK